MMNRELAINALHNMIDDAATSLAREIDDAQLPPLRDELNKILIHPYHINSHPCPLPPDTLRILIRIDLRHLLWHAYDQDGDLQDALARVRRQLKNILTRHSSRTLSEIIDQYTEKFSDYDHDEDEKMAA